MNENNNTSEDLDLAWAEALNTREGMKRYLQSQLDATLAAWDARFPNG